MRILNLQMDDGTELDLHPYVSVLPGLRSPARRRVIEELTRLVRGEAGAEAALVEAHDVLLPADEQHLAALDLPGEVDVVVRAEQLPGARLLAAQEEPSAASEQAVELARLDGEVEAVRERLAELQEELSQARRALDEFAVTAHETALAALGAAEAAARERAGGGEGDSQVRSELVARIEAERARSEDLGTELEGERVALLELLERLEEEKRRLEALRLETAQQEPERQSPVQDEELVAGVRAALEAFDAASSSPPMLPSLPAGALADQIATHRRRCREVEAELRAEGLDPDSLRAQLEAARGELAGALEASKPTTVTAADEAEIERLHDIVVENAQKRFSRRGGRSAALLYDEASTALEELLGRYGFPTYAAYVMGRATPEVDHDARIRLRSATGRVAELEEAVARAEELAESDPRIMVLRGEREQLWSEAEALLGAIPEDLEGALRALRVPGPAGPAPSEGLREMLGRAGVEVVTGDPELLRQAAAGWLEQQVEAGAASAAGDEVGAVTEQAALVEELLQVALQRDEALAAEERRLQELAERVGELEGELLKLDAAEGEGSPLGDASQRPLDTDPLVRELREQVKLTQARLERHHEAVERVDRLNAAVGEARAGERQLVALRRSLREELDATTEGSGHVEVEWELGEEGVEPIEWYLLGRVASLRSVSRAGSVPLVLDDAFRGLAADHARALCSALARIGESVQVIYVGDAEPVLAWAREQQLARAAVVVPGEPAA